MDSKKMMDIAEKKAKENNWDDFELPVTNDLTSLLIREVASQWDANGFLMNGVNHSWLIYQMRRYNQSLKTN